MSELDEPTWEVSPGCPTLRNFCEKNSAQRNENEQSIELIIDLLLSSSNMK